MINNFNKLLKVLYLFLFTNFVGNNQILTNRINVRRKIIIILRNKIFRIRINYEIKK